MGDNLANNLDLMYTKNSGGGSAATSRIKHVFSIDLESWVHFHIDIFGYKNEEYCTSAGRKKIDNQFTSGAIDNLLRLLNKCSTKATFFVLGEIFEWYPESIDKIKEAGHEIGFHTYDHQILKDPHILEDQLKRSREFLLRYRPRGFRAPQIYLTEDSAGVLKDWGFEYSSSSYGDYARRRKIRNIEEIPVSSFEFRHFSGAAISVPSQLKARMLFREIPFGSGLFLSVFQSKISYFIIKMERNGKPAILFIHPWQVYRTEEMASIKYKTKILTKRPSALPYTLSIKTSLERILNRHKFTSFEEMKDEN